jgi:hypothetical protein
MHVDYEESFADFQRQLSTDLRSHRLLLVKEIDQI